MALLKVCKKLHNIIAINKNTDLKIYYLKDKGQLSFEDKWPSMRPIVLKLLQQQPVTQAEWQELFYNVHLVCSWDEKGPVKMRDALQADIFAFIKQAQARVLANREEQALLKAYIVEWRKFFTQCNYLPTPFRQLESTLQGMYKFKPVVFLVLRIENRRRYSYQNVEKIMVYFLLATFKVLYSRYYIL